MYGFSDRYILCDYDDEENTIRIKNGFETEYDQEDQPELVFSIPMIRNPRSMMDIGYFNVSIFNGEDQLLYRFNETIGPNATITQVRPPESIELERDATQNGVVHNQTYFISSYSDLYDGDVISIIIPVPLRFGVNSKMIGVGYWIDGEMEASFSFDQRNITGVVQVANRRNLEDSGRNLRDDDVKYIPAGELIQIMITEVYPSSSLRPATESVYYESRTANGTLIEQLTEEDEYLVEIVNTEAGLLNSSIVEVLPSYMEKNEFANYTFSFIPKNFEQGMLMYLQVPPELTLSDEVTCVGLVGTSQQAIDCFYDWSRGRLVLPDAFVSSEIMPLQITFMVM